MAQAVEGREADLILVSERSDKFCGNAGSPELHLVNVEMSLAGLPEGKRERLERDRRKARSLFADPCASWLVMGTRMQTWRSPMELQKDLGFS